MSFKLLALYRGLLHKKPFLTNALTASAFMTIGDLISQKILQDGRNQLDVGRTTSFAIVGLIFDGPVSHGCFVALDKIFGHATNAAVSSKKLLADQILIAPVFLACEISLLTILRRTSREQARSELVKKYLDILKINYAFWPFVQILNFYFIPLNYRVLFGSGAALMWNVIFSYRLYNKGKTIKEDSNLIDEIDSELGFTEGGALPP